MAYKHKRSSVAGNVPAAGVLKPGEIAVNFVDKSIYTENGGGVVIELARDVYKSAVVPTSPAPGDMWFDTVNLTTQVWNGTAWTSLGAGGGAVSGANTEVQFNKSGSFGTNASFTYDSTTSTLATPNIAITGAVTANGTIGTAGQVLSSDGSKSYWANATNGTVTEILTGTGLAGGPITSNGTISLADTAVTAGAYGNTSVVPTFTVDAQGRLTAAGTSSLDWSAITTGKPTTLAGYGITDGVKSVNGILPDVAGNVAVNVTNVTTGLDGAMPAADAANEGDVYVVSGDTADKNGKTYISNGTTWLEISGPDMATYDARYVNLTGDTMTGALVLSADPTQPLEAATKQYVDAMTWDWATDITGKPSPVIDLALTGDITGTGSTTLTQLANGSISIATALDVTKQYNFTNTITFSNTITVSAVSANGAVGTAGQVLTSDGANAYWAAAAAGVAGSNTEIQFNNSGVLGSDASFTYNSSTSTLASPNVVSTGTITANAISANGSIGTTGQILTSNGTSTYWANSTASQIVLNAFVGDGATTAYTLSATPVSDVYVFPYINGVLQHETQYNVSGSTITFTNAPDNTANVEIRTVTALTLTDAITTAGGTVTGSLAITGNTAIGPLVANNSLGTAGQVLTSDGTSTYWSTASGLTADSQVAWTNTHSFSNTVLFSNAITVGAVNANGVVGTAGQVLYSDGASTYWANTSGSKWTDVGSDIYRNSNVAIGSTAAPTVALDVTGDVAITSNLVVDTTTLVVDSVNNRVGVGTATPLAAVDVAVGSATHAALVTTGAMDVALGQVFTITCTADTAFSITNAPAGRSTTVVLHVTDAGGFINSFTGIKWPSGTAPTLTAAGTDILVFTTHNGTTWNGNIFGKDIK